MNVFEHSKWLWCNAAPKENAYVDFFERFTLDTVAVRYTLYISADSDYAVYVNGKLCAFGQYADYENYKVYDTIDLSGCFRQGENELRVTVHHHGIPLATYRFAKAGVIYALYAIDELFIISSDDTEVALHPCYKSGAIERISDQLGHVCDYDATKENVGQTRRYADIVSKSKVLYTRPIGRPTVLCDRSVTVLEQGIYTDSRQPNLSLAKQFSMAYRSLRPSSDMTGAARVCLPQTGGILYSADRFESTADGIYLTVDLGVYTTGVFSLDIDVECDATVTVGYGETSDDLRRMNAENDRNQIIRYHAKEGRNTFIAPFLHLGARYLQLQIGCSAFRLYYAGMRPIEYPLDQTPYFTCSDRMHNKIYEACVRTLQSSVHTHYEDDPSTSQALTAMDARNQMLCGYYAFGEYNMAKENLRLLALSLGEDGYLSPYAPASMPFTVPSCSLIFVIAVEEYLRHSGDVAFVRDMLPTVHIVIDNFRGQLNTAKGLLKARTEEKYRNFYEAVEGLDGTYTGVYDGPLNAYFSMALRAVAHLCEACGEDETALRCIEDKELLDRRINDTFWDREHGAYASFVTEEGERFHYAELTNALLVRAEACTYANESTVLSSLAKKTLLPTTLANAIYKYEALLGRPELYAKAVFAEIADVWGEMLLNGQKTVYDPSPDGEIHGHCHGRAAIPVYLYFAYILGVKPIKDGFASYEQTPVNVGICDAKGLIVTPSGKIKL